MEIEKTIPAVFVVSFGIFLLNTLTLGAPMIFDHIDKITNAIVVVLIPPAVEEGADPINIIIE